MIGNIVAGSRDMGYLTPAGGLKECSLYGAYGAWTRSLQHLGVMGFGHVGA